MANVNNQHHKVAGGGGADGERGEGEWKGGVEPRSQFCFG